MSRFSNLEFSSQPQSHHEPATGSVQQSETWHLQEAAAAYGRGDFETALRSYAKALEFNPQNPLPWTGQVRMLIELGECREAKLWADKALEMFPHEAELLAAKAVALARTGDLKAAIAFSDASFSERGDSPWLWVARADVLLAQKEARADYCLDRAVALDPANWLLHWLISRVNAHYGRFVQALSAAQRALALDASRLQVWLQAALCQRHLGLLDAALESAGHAARLDPGNAAARKLLSSLEMTPVHLRWWCRFQSLFHR